LSRIALIVLKTRKDKKNNIFVPYCLIVLKTTKGQEKHILSFLVLSCLLKILS